MPLRRIEGAGWLALIGGGEFSFGETLDADRAWVDKTGAGASVGFLPTASGSVDYARHFAAYLDEQLDRAIKLIPVYRSRDARRRKNLERIESSPAIYIGGGVSDSLLEVLAESPARDALERRLREGAVVVAIAAAAQALGEVARGLRGDALPGLGWLPGTAVETNFTPAHDRRLRELLGASGVDVGLGLAAGSCLLLGPAGEVEVVGTVFEIDGAEGDIEPLGAAPDTGCL